ncbi:hypothetical protein A7U60_g1416 [Sanghuangporus baumii]|uniref:Uncharacterized protein n=1 Tax=Sanghuangporus baumii TaxID=108892 RepID=A0A9Q5I4G9_SANBA|nr:hypothetical protein A7U60_g1416 [Sanghuangporus baumii]
MPEGKMHRVHHRQITSIPPTPSGSAFTGAATLEDTSNIITASLLVDSTATGDPVGLQTTISISPTSSPSSLATSSTSLASESESDSISVGTVVGICVGVFAGLAVLILLAYRYVSRGRVSSPKGSGKEGERRKSGRELWVKMEEHDGDGSYEKYAIKRTTMNSISPSDGTGTTTVGRSITVKSAKSAKTFKSLGYGTNLGLAETFKTPDLPPQLEFTDSDIGTGQIRRSFVGNAVSTAPFARVENPPISWDGETVGEKQSYLSLKSGSGSVQYATVTGPVSPQMVVSHQTPPAVQTQIPQWERAEVVSPDGAEAYGGVDEPRHPYAMRFSQETVRNLLVQPQSASQGQTQTENPFGDQNPFDDPASRSTPAISGTSDSESFFTTKSDLTTRTGAFAAATATATHHERMDSNERAMASLIAALNITQEEARERLSAASTPTPRESTASGYSLGLQSDESKVSLDEASFKQFPLPPTDIKRRPAS